MNILEIYEKYKIMPQLQEHMLKVAGVADLIVGNIFNHLSLIPDRKEIISACLLHDIGNIVKFDFDIFPEAAAHKGFEYWQEVKQDIIARYGNLSHTATHNILKEIGVSQRVVELADCVGFDQGVDNMDSKDFGKKICAYSDMRVLPFGVSSLEERMADLRARYKNHPEGAKDREVFENALREIEKQIFEHCKIRLEDITEESIKPKLEKLRNWEI